MRGDDRDQGSMFSYVSLEAAASMLASVPGKHGVTLGADKGSDTQDFVGWMKSVGLMRKVRHRGRDEVGWVFTFTAAAYHLVRLRGLAAAPL